MLDTEDLADRIRRHMAFERVPAVGLAVIENGAATLAAGFGVESVDAPVGVDADTCFQIGSVTKPLVATAIMRLVERGEADLDRPVDGVQAEGATLRTLLSHASGLADVGFVAPAAYSNAAYMLAAHSVESSTGRSMDELLAETVLEPLGMTRTFLNAPSTGIARGHDSGLRPLDVPHRDDYAPARGAYSTASDLASFALAHLGVGKPLLEPATLRQMHEPASGRRFAVGFEVRDYKDVRLVRHSGDIGPYRAWLIMAPAHGFAVAMVCSRPPLFRLTSAPFRILDAALQLPDFPFSLGCPACGAELFGEFSSCTFCTPK